MPRKTQAEIIAEKEEKIRKEQKALQELKKAYSKKERSKRTHRLCIIGGKLEEFYGRDLDEKSINVLIEFLIDQETKNNKIGDGWVSKWMQKHGCEPVNEKTKKSIKKENINTQQPPSAPSSLSPSPSITSLFAHRKNIDNTSSILTNHTN